MTETIHSQLRKLASQARAVILSNAKDLCTVLAARTHYASHRTSVRTYGNVFWGHDTIGHFPVPSLALPCQPVRENGDTFLVSPHIPPEVLCDASYLRLSFP